MGSAMPGEATMVKSAAAHWLTPDTMAWRCPLPLGPGCTVQLHASPTAGLRVINNVCVAGGFLTPCFTII